MTFAYNKRAFIKQVVFALLVVILYRFLACLKLPFINETYSLTQNSTESILAMLTGGTQDLTFASLGISPYISASIFMQFLSAFVPSLSDLQKGGETGQHMVKRITLYVSFGIAILSAPWFIMARASDNSVLLSDLNMFFIVWSITALTPCLFAVIAHKMSNTPYCDGISLFLAAGIVGSFPKFILSAYEAGTENVTYSFIPILSSFLGLTFMFFIVCFVMSCKFSVPLSYSQKRPNGNFKEDRLSVRYLSNSVMPVIFASGIMSFLSKFSNKAEFFMILRMDNWFWSEKPVYSAGIAVYFLLILLFTRVTRYISFNEREVSENLRQNSCVIPGVSAGEATVRFLKKSFRRLNFTDSLFLCIVTILPLALSSLFDFSVTIAFPSGASVILLAGILRTYLEARKADKKSEKYADIFDKLKGEDKFALFTGGIMR